MHSELSEALEEYRNGHAAREVYFTTDGDGHDKPEGICVELADCAIRIMHCFDNFGMDLGAIIALKLQYNAKRGHKHGGKVI